MSRRFDFFRRECPSAGDPFPPLEGLLLDGRPWRSADYAGRVLVLETGSFT